MRRIFAIHRIAINIIILFSSVIHFGPRNFFDCSYTNFSIILRIIDVLYELSQQLLATIINSREREKKGKKWKMEMDETYETFRRMIGQIPRAENGSGSVNGGSGGGGGRVFFHGGSQSSVLSDPK